MIFCIFMLNSMQHKKLHNSALYTKIWSCEKTKMYYQLSGS